MGFFEKMFAVGPSKEELKKAVELGAVIIDVRSAEEFSSGHPKGAENIPVNIIDVEVDRIKKYEKTIIVCCASGGRSAAAARVLKTQGIEVIDAGAWDNLKF